MISIIIPVVDNIEYTYQCIESIVSNTTTEWELIIIDNGSEIPFVPSGKYYMEITAMGDLSRRYFPREGVGALTIIRNEENLGFPKAVNQGLVKSSGEYILILNNDVILGPEWDVRFLKHLKKYDIVGPVTNSISGPQQVFSKVYENLGEFYEVATNRTDSIVKSFYRLVMFCFMMKRAVCLSLGLLDEAFTPGNYEDDDYCLRAVEKGFKMGICNDVYVHHFGSTTFDSLNMDVPNIAMKNRLLFLKKWPDNRREELKKLAMEGSNVENY